MFFHRRQTMLRRSFYWSGKVGANAKLHCSQVKWQHSLRRFQQNAKDIGGKNKGEMALVKALEVFSNEADADRISEVVEKNLRPELFELRAIHFVVGMEKLERSGGKEMAML